MQKERIKKIVDSYWKFSGQKSANILYFSEEKPFEKDIPAFSDAEINQSYLKDNKKWGHPEFLCSYYGNISIEPDYGYCISGYRNIIRDSVFYPGVKPSLPRFLNSFFNKRTTLESAVVFDGKVGLNYFHFFSDVFHKLFLLENFPEIKDLPLIVGEDVFNKKYFQFFYSLPEIKALNWKVQKKGEYISSKEVFLLHPLPYKYEYYGRIRELVLGKTKHKPERNVFLTRSKEKGRNISNFDEISPVLKEFGFELIDTNNMELNEQASIFSNSKHLIALHGAGITNIIFSQPTLRLLELMPADRMACHYYWLAKSLGIEYYDVITGDALEQNPVSKNGMFRLDPVKFKDALKRLIV